VRGGFGIVNSSILFFKRLESRYGPTSLSCSRLCRPMCGKAMPFRSTHMLVSGKAEPCETEAEASSQKNYFPESHRLSAHQGGKAASDFVPNDRFIFGGPARFHRRARLCCWRAAVLPVCVSVFGVSRVTLYKPPNCKSCSSLSWP